MVYSFPEPYRVHTATRWAQGHWVEVEEAADRIEQKPPAAACLPCCCSTTCTSSWLHIKFRAPALAEAGPAPLACDGPCSQGTSHSPGYISFSSSQVWPGEYLQCKMPRWAGQAEGGCVGGQGLGRQCRLAGLQEGRAALPACRHRHWHAPGTVLWDAKVKGVCRGGEGAVHSSHL